MVEVRGVAQRLTSWTPDGLAQRVRLLFAVFAMLVAPLSSLRLLEAGVPLVPNGVAVLTALAAIGAWAWCQYRSGGLPWWADPVPVVGLFVAGWQLGDPRLVYGLMFVVVFGRALYGSGLRVWAGMVGFFVAYEAAAVVTAGVASVLDVSLVVTGLGLVFSVGVMVLVGEVLRAHERGVRREVALAMAASRLQQAEDHDVIYRVAGAAGLELCAAVDGAAVTLWRGDAEVLRMGHGAGRVADDTPTEVPMAVVPEGLRRQLLAGEPFALDKDDSALVQQAVDMQDSYVSMLIAPLTHGSRFGGALAIASRRPLPDELVAALGRLAADVGLALARADSAALLHRVVENSSDAMVLLDSSLRVVFASPAAGTLFGASPDGVVGQAIGDLLEVGERDVGEVLEHAVEGVDGDCPPIMARRGEDLSRQVELAATHMTGTGVDGWVVNLRDVTRRAEFEQALRASEHRFRSLAENVSEGMYQMTLRPEPRYEYVNPAMEEMCGFPAQAFLDDVDLTVEHVHPDDRGVIERTRTAPDEVQWPIEVRWHRPSGEWAWISFRESVVHDADGVPIGTMGILSDITARKVQEQALQDALGREREASERLRHVDAMRTTFIQAVSHELRTPLTAITGYSQTLHRGHDRLDRATHLKLLERLEANAHKLDRLLADLLDVDRLSSHEIEPVRRDVDLVRLVRRVVEQIDHTTHPITCANGSVVAHLDAPKVERIVENLVRNARKHTAPGTPITVTVETVPGGDGVVLTVADEGPGIPDELVDTIFDPFVQGAGSATSATPGMGIGLSLVARFAEMHGGHARVENRAEGGAAFSVWLPSAPTGHGHEASRPRIEALAAGGCGGDGRPQGQGTSSRTSVSAS